VGRRIILTALAVLVAASLGVFFFVAPQWVEDRLNGVGSPPPYAASAAARALHQTLVVADLHADPLLWGRDLVERGKRGHVDIPRLAEGNIALEVFAVVTQSPRGMNIERNDSSTDNILPLGIAQRWPPKTWVSLLERALYQAARLKDMARRSDGKFVLIRTRRDLAVFLQRRKSEPAIVAGLLALEGAHALEGDPENVDRLFDAGYRMISFAHFFDSEMGGSAHGVEKGGLTDKGRELLRRMEEKKMIVDLSHASARQIDDVLELATRPVVVSHAGVRGTCDNNRNLSDDQLRAIAGNGGLVGIGFWETAVCGTDARAIAAAQRYAADLIGADHVGLGSDFDGSVKVPFDATGIVQVTEALLETGFDNEDIAKIMGGNEIRLLLANLPD
jgi:membrane dipeptidase